ncbi:water channel activity protein [Paramecium bursaria]
MAILMIFFLSILLTERLTIFNPAVSFIELLASKIQFQEFLFNVGGQIAGSFLGAMLGYFMLGNYVDQLPYLDARLKYGLLGSMSGEILGSLLLMALIVLQEDDYLKFTDDKFEHALLITLTFGAVRMLSYTSGSLFNPAFAFSLELFECIKDGNWGRFGFLWIYIVGPFMGAIAAIIFDSQIYKKFYDQKIKYGL